MIYVASPYSHPDREVRVVRFNQVRNYCGRMIEKGLVVYSPIVHNHPIAISWGFPKDFQFWEKFDLEMVSKADSMRVLCIDGWEESKGIRAEIKHALKLQLPILYVDEYDVDIYKAKKEPKSTAGKKKRTR